MTFLRSNAGLGDSNGDLISDSASNVNRDLEARAESPAVNRQPTKSVRVLVHRDALGRQKQVSTGSPGQHGWYLNPNDAKLAELRKIQSSTVMESKVPWVIQMAASAYECDGEGDLHIRMKKYIIACATMPALVSRAHLNPISRPGLS
jgi:hypothetical protein